MLEIVMSASSRRPVGGGSTTEPAFPRIPTGGTVAAPVTHSLVKALRTVPDFAALDDHALLKVVGASTNLFWPKGEVIFEKDSESEGLYIILSGEVRIFEVQRGREEEVSRIGPGNSFGE